MSSKQFLDSLLRANSKFNIFTSIRDVIPISKPGFALSGMRAAVKDNIVTTKEPTTGSSKILENYKSPYESSVTKLLEANGAVIVGKTNMDEFGMGSATIHSIYGPTTNPLYPNEKRVSGGSSGGSAAAVAAGIVEFSIGTDTGGSVRLPAAYCGIVGFKPTYGRISRWGVIAYSQSLDTVGILANKISTIRKVYKVLDIYDAKDPTSLHPRQRDSVKIGKRNVEKIKFGIIEELNLAEMSPDTVKAWTDMLSKVIAQGHEVVRISVPVIKSALPAYYTLAPAEASSNLSRYDGIRYGHRSEVSDKSDDAHFAFTREEGFGIEVQRRILMGTYNLSSEAYNNHFIKAQKIRQELCDQFDTVFKSPNVLSSIEPNENGVDFIIAPCSMTPAPLLDSFKNKEAENPVNSYVNDTLTVPSSLAGIPTISIPWKVSDTQTPIGMQIIGQFGHDEAVLNVAEDLLEE